jgi:transposase-like protein
MYKRHRFPPEIIRYAVWIYYRFNLSHRDIEDLLAERGITVSYESIRLCCNKFGPKFARRLKKKHQGYGDTFFIDEVFVKIQGKAAKRFLSVHAAVYNLFNLGRHLVSAKNYRIFRMRAFASWEYAVV